MQTSNFTRGCCKYMLAALVPAPCATAHVPSVMSPNGTLMAYSTPVDIKELRDQAALISMAWKDQDNVRKNKPTDLSTDTQDIPPLETLTIETANNNIIVRAIQPNLLLVLVGAVPPSRKEMFKITPEAHGDPRYPPAEVPDEPQQQEPPPPQHQQQPLGLFSSPSAESVPTDQFSVDEALVFRKKKTASLLSTMSQRNKDIKLGVLHIQRKKIDALTHFMRADFDAKGFVMPDDSSFP